jgi:hypothetical protein
LKNYSKDSWTTKKGLTTAGKAGIVVILVILVLGGVYFAPSLLTGSGTKTTSSQPVGSSSNSGRSSQTISLLTLFGYFSKMQIHEFHIDHNEGNIPDDQHTISYVVLGKASLNSTTYTKVKFSQIEAKNDIIAWFNPQGGVDRADVLGTQNYTGPTAAFYVQTYTAALSAFTNAANNATLLSFLSKTSENTTSIGPTQLHVVTYMLAAPTPPFTSLTIRIATIPGTNTKLVVYLDENTTDNMETTAQILSLTK